MRTLNAPHPPAATLLQDACVAMLFDDGSCLLDSGVRARRALSCLVEPRAGDRVLVGARPDGAHVLHIVEREPCGAVCLSAPGAQASQQGMPGAGDGVERSPKWRRIAVRRQLVDSTNSQIARY